MKKMQPKPVFFKTLLRWVIIICLAFFLTTAIHESSHAVACKAMGGKILSMRILSRPSTDCGGIVENGVLAVTPERLFAYEIAPYIVGVLILLGLGNLAIRKRAGINFSYFLAIFVLLDTLYNYGGSLFYGATDFANVARVSARLFWMSAAIVASGAITGIIFLVRQWREWWSSFRQSFADHQNK